MSGRDAVRSATTFTSPRAGGEVFHIAPLTVADADELGALHVEVWRETYAGLMPADYLAALDPADRADMWRSTVTRNSALGVVTLVARGGDGGIVGFISAGRPRDEDAPAATQLWAINLLRVARGTGLAQELVRLALGDRDAYLWVADGNERAMAFYRRLGFVLDGGTDVHPTGASELRMVRRRTVG